MNILDRMSITKSEKRWDGSHTITLLYKGHYADAYNCDDDQEQFLFERGFKAGVIASRDYNWFHRTFVRPFRWLDSKWIHYKLEKYSKD